MCARENQDHTAYGGRRHLDPQLTS